MKKNISKNPKKSKASVCREATLVKTIGPEDLYKILQPSLQNLVQEVAWSVSLDCMGRVLSIDEIGRGPVDHVEVYPRELFRPAIESAATYVVMAHFHPSGDKTPSDEDQALTRKMIRCGQILSLPCVDHLVVTKTGFTALSRVIPEFHFPDLAPPYDRSWTQEHKTDSPVKTESHAPIL